MKRWISDITALLAVLNLLFCMDCAVYEVKWGGLDGFIDLLPYEILFSGIAAAVFIAVTAALTILEFRKAKAACGEEMLKLRKKEALFRMLLLAAVACAVYCIPHFCLFSLNENSELRILERSYDMNDCRIIHGVCAALSLAAIPALAVIYGKAKKENIKTESGHTVTAPTFFII